MIDLTKLAKAAKAAEKSADKAPRNTVRANVSDGVLTLTIPLVGSEPNDTGKSIPVARLSGVKVEGTPGFRQTADGDLIEVPGLVAHVHGGVSVYSRDPGVRAALGLVPLGGAQ